MLDTENYSNPFPGLRSFEPEEDHLFFGREARIDEILTRLRRSRFLSVVGTSGSGKSSLIRSGLIPSLYSGMMASAGSSWRIAIFRPGEDPIGNLAAALDVPEVIGGPDSPTDTSKAFLEVTLRRSQMGLVECIRQARIPAHENILIIADQFEELFRFKNSRQLRESHDDAIAFVKLLLNAVGQQQLPVYVVITMRSDFIGNCTEFEGLTEAINDGQYLVPRMDREERRSAITGPVAVGGAEISPRLILRLLNDVGDDPDQLPILQHAMMRTWEYWQQNHAEGDPIDLNHYEAIGTMSEALSRHAEETYLELDTPERKLIAEKMFKALTDRGSDARGVRSPRRLEELCALTGASEADVASVIDVFRRPGRSFLMPPADVPLHAASVIDISHESLMRIWTRLIQWVDEEARSAQMYLRISRAALQHQEGQAGLMRDPELQLALNWRDEARPSVTWAERYDPAFERAILFLEESERQRNVEIAEKERQRIRQLRWTRRLAIILGSAAVVTLVFGLYAMTLKIEADANLKEAVTQKERAETQQKETERQRLLAEEERKRAEQQTVVAGQQRTRAEEQTKVSEQQKQIADRQREIAQRESQEALRQKAQAESARSLEAVARQESERDKAVAIQQRTRADEARVQSEKAEAEARRLRMLAVARALAIQTTRMISNDQRDLAALLALQAYSLHEKNGGVPEDSQIFDALRSSLARLDPKTVGALKTLPDAVRSVRSSPDSGFFAAGGDDGSVWVTDLAASTVEPRRVLAAGSEIRALEWLEGGKRLAVGTLDGQVRLLDPATTAAPTVLVGPGPGVTAFAANARGTLLAVAVASGDVTLRSIAQGGAAPRALKTVAGKPIASLVFLPDGRLVGSSPRGGTFVWNPERPDDAPRRILGDRPIRSLALAPDGRLAAGTEEGPILLVARGLDGTPAELTGHGSAVTALRFASQGGRLASGSLDGSLRLWDVDHPEREPIVLTGHTGWVWAVDFAARGQRLVSGGADRTTRSWPTQVDPLAAAICQRVRRTLTMQEWREYTSGDIPLQTACTPSAGRTGSTR
jgi:energy-coupling factor transporter ATP-binding protein EcfA2